MQAILFIGIQATGKSTFYTQHFLNSHVRISMDLLNTRNKEKKFLETCYATQTAFVVDNTNPTQADRARYIPLALEHQYEVIGYYFKSHLKEALHRNSQRSGKAQIPEVGILSTYKKLELPNYDEGFTKIFYVEIQNGTFMVTPWKDEV